MITTLDEYAKLVEETGTPEAKMLFFQECLFAGTEAKAILGLIRTSEHATVTERMLVDRLVCLLIAHRGPVMAGYLMERARGVTMAVDGPGPVVPSVPPHDSRYS